MKKTERRTKGTPNESVSAHAVRNSTNANKGGFPNLAEIKELIEIISEKQFNEFELQQGDFYLRVQKSLSGIVTESSLQSAVTSDAVVEARAGGSVSAATAPVPAEEKLHIITSPFVGTFFRSPSPTAEPFVKPGDQVEVGQKLCIIEAMKLMNEIQADESGTIARIFAENGQPVEYGQQLFGIKV